jgi:flagellin
VEDNIMAMVINTNIGSLNSQRMLNSTNNSLKTSMERLSSGLRVNSAKDDAAGLAIGNKMTSQIRGMTVAIRNANDGISMAQTAEAAMGSITETLQRMRDLAVQSSNTGAVNAADQSKLQTEFEQLQKEIGRIITNTEFNGKKILNGGLSGQVFQVGANTTSDNRISLTVNNLSAAASTGLGSILL